jgi:nitrous oxide reductase
MRRTGWTAATACAAIVAIGGAQLVGTNGHGNAGGQDVSGVSSAAAAPGACTERTLRGSYVFSASGFNIVGGVPQPKAIVEVIVFNGDGTLDVPAATVSLNGMIIRSLHSVGTYTVEDTCAGTVTFNGPTYDMFLSKDGDEISMIQTNPNTVFQGLATRTSRMVREVSQD